MASGYQQYQTPPRQSVAAYSIHSSAGDLGITITLDIMKVTHISVSKSYPYSKSRGKSKLYKTHHIIQETTNIYVLGSQPAQKKVLRRKRKQ